MTRCPNPVNAGHAGIKWAGTSKEEMTMTTITDEIDMQALERAENVSLETLLNYDPVRFNERILFV